MFVFICKSRNSQGILMLALGMNFVYSACILYHQFFLFSCGLSLLPLLFYLYLYIPAQPCNTLNKGV